MYNKLSYNNIYRIIDVCFKTFRVSGLLCPSNIIIRQSSTSFFFFFFDNTISIKILLEKLPALLFQLYFPPTVSPFFFYFI